MSHKRHTCNKNHPVEKSAKTNNWGCDGCGRRSRAETGMVRHRCTEGCDYDLCERCWTPQAAAPKARAAAPKAKAVAKAAQKDGHNDENVPVKMTAETGKNLGKYYCGRRVGREALPGSDGQCGPNNGPQCASCTRFQTGHNHAEEKKKADAAKKKAEEAELKKKAEAALFAKKADAEAEAAAAKKKKDEEERVRLEKQKKELAAAKALELKKKKEAEDEKARMLQSLQDAKEAGQRDLLEKQMKEAEEEERDRVLKQEEDEEHRLQILEDEREERAQEEQELQEEKERAEKELFEYPTYQKFLFDLIVVSLGLMMVDIGSDVAVVRTYAKMGYPVLFGVSLSMMILPMAGCWLKLYFEGAAEVWELPLYVLQIKTLTEVYEAAKRGKKDFDMIFISMCEICWEGFGQSTMSMYAVLCGLIDVDGEGTFGLPAQRVFEISALISWASAGKALAQMDRYVMLDECFHAPHRLVVMGRGCFRFLEVSVRVLSLAYFAALMRPHDLAKEANGQTAIWVVLAIDWMIQFCLVKFVARLESNKLIWTSVFLYCAPMHFLDKNVRRLLPLYYSIRFAEMAVMGATAVYTVPADHRRFIFERAPLLWFVFRLNLCLFTLFWLANQIAADVLPSNKIYGETGWLLIPLERKADEDYDEDEEDEFDEDYDEEEGNQPNRKSRSKSTGSGNYTRLSARDEE